MKVDSQNASIQLSAYLKKVTDPQAQCAGQGQSCGAKVTTLDRVQLSQQALQVQHAREMLAQMSEICSEKVDRVRAAVMQGTYHVPAMTVAGDMVRESLENEMILRKIDIVA